MIGRTLAHYRITAAISAGGMGEVYRATDTKLGREVALKVLPAEMAASPERLERFRREARALAALDHPGIVTIYSVEEAEGVHFLTMQLVEGQPLDVLIPDGGMPLDRIVAIGTDLAEALAAAHEKGVVHRDMKPANVVVGESGSVKVLDFGLAKMNAAADATDSALQTEARTREGVLMGTVPYMSPEQVAGRAVDHRTDVFSLGVVLYEMASGRRPFQGGSTAELASAILRDTPQALEHVRPELPDDLCRMVSRCLRKEPAQRFPTLREAAAALRGLRGGAPPLSHAPTRASSASASPTPSSGARRSEEGFWVAVLPFKQRGTDPSLLALAEGLTEEIVTGLSRFSYLRVIAHGSTARYTGEGLDARAAGREIGARYVMEGSLRQAGGELRAAVQMIDVSTGAHLWSESYTRPFAPDRVFAIQDDLVPRIVSTFADRYGVLARSISDAVRSKPTGELRPYEALMRAFGYHYRLLPEEHAEAREALERAVELAPDNADCWAMLSWVYSHEHAHGFNPRPEPLDRALRAARRAVDLAPSSHFAHQALAVVLFFRKEKAGCLSAAERSLALNPLDASNEAIFLITFAGDWEGGIGRIRRAMEQNPHHPRWYEWVLAVGEYRLGRYRAAVDEVVKSNMPEVFWKSALVAAAYGALGESEAAGKALRELLARKPDFAESGRRLFELWFDAELVEHLMDGLGKAGLGGLTPQAAASTKSIVVLPFANLSSEPDTEYFSDGLTDEIITDLSRVRALRVISRSSAMRLKGDARGLAEIGRDLACRYVLEGSVRRAANSLRITARLVDASNDVQLWADKFGGTLEDVFDIQERVSRSIVDALEIHLTPQEAAQLAERPIADVRAQESYLRARSEIWSFLPGNLDRAVSHLEAALRLVGDNALVYQGLGEAYFQYVNIGAAIGREEELIRKSEQCADKIFALEPESPRGHFVRANARLARGDVHGCGRSFRRVLQASPNEAQALALYAHLLGWLVGKPDAAAPVAARLVDLDPLNPMSLLVSAMVPLFAGRFAEAVERAHRMFVLDSVTPVWRSNYFMALGYARRLDEAEALTEGMSAEPDSDIGTWWMGLWRAAWRADRAEVLRLAAGPYRQLAAWDAEVPWALASAHAAVGLEDEALSWLERAIERGMINWPFLSEHDRYLDDVRGDARFRELMDRARREWERFEV